MNGEEPRGGELRPAVPSMIEMLRGNSSNILGVFLCYFLGAALGYFWPEVIDAAALGNLMKAVEESQKQFQGHPVQIALSNFGHSLVILYMAMMLGILGAVPPVYLILSEGIYQGSIAVHSGGGWWHALPISLPDVLELYAASIALGWGVKIGMSWLGPPRLLKLKTAFMEGHRVFFRLAFLLLLASAASEIAASLL